jgi:hypothetical protein
LHSIIRSVRFENRLSYTEYPVLGRIIRLSLFIVGVVRLLIKWTVYLGDFVAGKLISFRVDTLLLNLGFKLVVCARSILV